MRMKLALNAAVLLAISALAGCADKSCNKADSQAVCQQTKLCFASGTAVSSCRTAEKAAREYESNYQNNIAPALSGVGNALLYDPGTKAVSKPPPPHTQPKQQPRKQ